ncbi:aminopeptidase [Oxalobacteraceae bacterium CAVE-383]|nr:aminopeptidase [Oxalobacteraceae bacterium CAVE-383]
MLALCLSALGGCGTLGYYAQAAHGQFSLLAQARPIDDWLADPQTPPHLQDKLRELQQIRRFAVSDLGLPDNDSYTTYAKLPGRYALWNVVAAPALSLTPRRWCFPVAGCVNYRGYYDHQAALDFAAQLKNEGDDVQVLGVPAYSTLGWFKDPVLSTFINYPDAELARLVFHELAHQKYYIKGDSEFNESFATAVESAGVARWLRQYGTAAQEQAYRVFEQRKRDFLALLLRRRAELGRIYASDADDSQKLREKAAVFDALRADYEVLKQHWGGYAGYDRWFAAPLSNAHLALVATYHDLEPGFAALLRQSSGFPQFYARVKALGALDKNARHQALRDLAKNACPDGCPQDSITKE